MAETGIQLGIDRALTQVMEHLSKGNRAWVVGDVGSGRTTLGRLLKQELGEKAVFVQLNEREEPDAAISGFYELARELPSPSARSSCWKDWSRFSQAVDALDQAAGTEEPWTLIINLPTSWERNTAAKADDWDYFSTRRCQDLIAGLSHSKQRVIWITSRTTPPNFLGSSEFDVVRLPKPKNATAILKTVDWKSYQSAADELSLYLDDEAVISPIVLRLAVGVVKLGASASVVAERVKESTVSGALHSLSEDLADSLAKQDEGCREAIGRLLLARKPVKTSALHELTSVLGEHAPLLTDCIGYGTGEVRISPSLKAHLQKRLELSPERRMDAHAKFRDYYTQLDGKLNIEDTFGEQTIAWIEKMYHELQCSNEVVLDALPCREFFWARGRHLSRTLCKYEEAAQVYAACAARFPDDDYARHYWAFNLERAGESREIAEREFREAVNLHPDHLWWNSRLVTFLIRQGRPRAARTAWKEALDRLDPDGDRILQSPDLAEQLHHWVAKEWLEAGYVADAVEILRLLSKEVISQSPRLQALEQSILAAAEADALGFAVYPNWVPMEKRWQHAQRLPREQLQEWWPGRVISAERDAVKIGYGVRKDDGLHSLVTEVKASEWNTIGFGTPEAASGYVELGYYADGNRKIVHLPESPEQELHVLGQQQEPSEAQRRFAYLDRWRSPTFPSSAN